MSSRYASVEDIEVLWRELSSSEHERATALIEVVSSSLDYAAKCVGKNLFQMLLQDDNLIDVAKSVTVDVVARTLMTSTDQEPMTQMSESAGGYTASGSFLVPGGGLFIKKSELERLGLRRQRYGVVDFYGHD